MLSVLHGLCELLQGAITDSSGYEGIMHAGWLSRWRFLYIRVHVEAHALLSNRRMRQKAQQYTIS